MTTPGDEAPKGESMPSAPSITLEAPHLVFDLPGRHRCVSWALVGGGFADADSIVWREVRNADLGPDVDATELLRDSLKRAERPEAVGLLTSAPLKDYCAYEASEGAIRATAVATVGLANALTAGDPADTSPRKIGTINIAICISEELSDQALLEALSIATEARTRAVLEAQVPSIVSGQMATGTGTDCIAVAARSTGRSAPDASPKASPELFAEVFAGKHTLIGSLVGKSCYEATKAGIAKWRIRRAALG